MYATRRRCLLPFAVATNARLPVARITYLSHFLGCLQKVDPAITECDAFSSPHMLEFPNGRLLIVDSVTNSINH